MPESPEPSDKSHPEAVDSNALFDGFRSDVENVHLAVFRRVDRDMMKQIDRLQSRLMEFHTARRVWADISANNNAPGRGSELQTRMESFQGQALVELIGEMHNLREMISPSNAKVMSAPPTTEPENT